MEYEYKSIMIDSLNLVPLNNLYEDGWEFVDSVAQVVSTGASQGSKGFIIFTLRRLIEKMTF